MIKHVKDLDRTDFTIKFANDLFFGQSEVLCRKDVPLMRMGCKIDEVDIFITGGEEYPEEGKDPYTLIVQDHKFKDCYTYGNWKTLVEFEKWFEKPVRLY